MECKEILEKLGDFLDEEAREELCRTIEEHLAQCHDCRVYVDTVRKTIVLYQADNQVEIPLAVSARLEAALEREYSMSATDPKSGRSG